MNKEAIFSDGTRMFLIPPEPNVGDRVFIRIRTAHADVAEVYLRTPEERIRMYVDREEFGFDYYKTRIDLGKEAFAYIFEVVSPDETCFFDRYGLSNEIRFQYAFRIQPGFSTPAWSKGAVMYQILVDRFCNGDETNDVVDNEYHYIMEPVKAIKDWNTLPSSFDVGHFYGGDLEGVRQKLYYLKSLGVEVIYFNPIFVSPSNHKYDTQDYDYIDPHYAKIVVDGGDVLKDGDYNNANATKYKERVANLTNLEASNKYFAEFVEEAHQKGIRIILDGVFNHCGSFNKWLDREHIYAGREGFAPGAYSEENSPYKEYFQWHDEKAWPNNSSYDSWWGNDTLPKLNYEESEALQDYVISIGRKWVSPPYNCDGWRLDVAADLGHSEEFNHKFWERFRREVKDANPDAIILAEHYGDATRWLQGDQWDTIMNYDAFMEPVSYFLTGMDKHSDKFKADALCNGEQFELTMRHTMTAFLTPSLFSAMNQLSNHDHSRFMTRTNHTPGRVATHGSAAASEGINPSVMKLGTMMLMTWPGAPTIYYGDEAGVCGFTDPDNRRTYPWGDADYPLIDFHRDMILLHKVNPALKRGSFVFLKCEKNIVSYGRFIAEQQMAVVINSSDETVATEIPVWKANIPRTCEITQIMTTYVGGYSIKPVRYKVVDGYVKVELKPYSGIVLNREKPGMV